MVLGVVKTVLPTGANDVLVVGGDAESIDRKERLIPFISQTVLKLIWLRVRFGLTGPRILMKWGVITLFPTMVADVLAHGVIGRAMQRGLVNIITFNPRVHATDSHQTVDDRPYGGGPGMLMKVETLRASIAEAKKILPEAPVIYLSPQGEPLTQSVVKIWLNDQK